MENNNTNNSLANNIQAFSGTENENLEYFIKNIEQIALLENWTPQRKFLILKLNLSGNALKFISSHPKINKINTFEDLCTILRSKFKKSKSFNQLQADFNNISQKQGQSVSSLIEEIEASAESYLGINEKSSEETMKLAEKIKSQKFLEALRPEIRIEVMKRGFGKFVNIAKAAKNVEIALNNAEAYCNNITKNSEIDLLIKSQTETNKTLLELKTKFEATQMRHTNNTVLENNTRRINDRNFTCHICNKNHKTTDCWYFPTNNRQALDNFKAKFRGYRSNYRLPRNLSHSNRQHFGQYRSNNQWVASSNNFSRSNRFRNFNSNRFQSHRGNPNQHPLN